MTSTREMILGDIRDALRDRNEGDSTVSFESSPTPALAAHARADFLERLKEYGTTVVESFESEISSTIDSFCAAEGVRSLAVPDAFPPDWLPTRLGLHHGYSIDALSKADGALTGCALAIAETGSIVLNGGPTQGPRVLTLIPPLHIAVVLESQLVPSLEHAMAKLRVNGEQTSQPITIISGPSATTDIELVRVVGVHGPSRLVIIWAR